jgi:prepilin-type N-terminal cleavage/methylation domain-containing protein
MSVKILNINQRGDTIVEVLIAMVILAFVLTGAYESSQYSINTIRNAENRITAVDIATNQIEALKAWAATAPSIPAANFYMSGVTPTIVPNATPPTSQNFFMYQIQAPVLQTNSNYTFIVNVYWPDLNSNSVNNACAASTLSNCDNISVPYRTAVNPSAVVTLPATILASGGSLSVNQKLTSPNNQYYLIMQGDGNLVLYTAANVPLWASNTGGTPSTLALMQKGDGNFVVYTASGSPTWASNTSGNPGAYLSLNNNGVLAIYTASGTILWSQS